MYSHSSPADALHATSKYMHALQVSDVNVVLLHTSTLDGSHPCVCVYFFFFLLFFGGVISLDATVFQSHAICIVLQAPSVTSRISRVSLQNRLTDSLCSQREKKILHVETKALSLTCGNVGVKHCPILQHSRVVTGNKIAFVDFSRTALLGGLLGVFRLHWRSNFHHLPPKHCRSTHAHDNQYYECPYAGKKIGVIMIRLKHSSSGQIPEMDFKQKNRGSRQQNDRELPKL